MSWRAACAAVSCGAALLLPACDEAQTPAAPHDAPGAIFVRDSQKESPVTEVEPPPELLDGELPAGTREQSQLLVRARARTLAGDEAGAAEAYAELATSEPLSAAQVSGALALGESFLAADRREVALKVYEELEVRGAEVGLVQLELGEAYVRMAAWPEARAAYERAIALRPDYFFAWWRLGEVRRALGDEAAALEAEARGAREYERARAVIEAAMRGGESDEVRQAGRLLSAFSMFELDASDRAFLERIAAMRGGDLRLRELARGVLAGASGSAEVQR